MPNVRLVGIHARVVVPGELHDVEVAVTIGMSYHGLTTLRKALQCLTDHDLSLAHKTLEDEKQARKQAASKKRFDLRRDANQAQRDFEALCEKLGLSGEMDEP